MLTTDVKINQAIGMHGAQHIMDHCQNQPLQLLTHCNTGSLATAGYGTALGVIRALHFMGHLKHTYFTETRPYNQGARLTGYELVHEGIPSTLICDDMVGWLMKVKGISAVIVGADRVVANGDTANKIGTYQVLHQPLPGIIVLVVISDMIYHIFIVGYSGKTSQHTFLCGFTNYNSRSDSSEW